MGRKKRKVESTSDDGDNPDQAEPSASSPLADETTTTIKPTTPVAKKEDDAPAKSGYAMTSHSGEIIQEDIYVSDGSEDSDDEDEVEIVLVGSRMGIMRRGLHQLSALQQPNRQWTRQAATDTIGVDGSGTVGANNVELTEEEKRRQEEEELAKLDPAQRAARLLQEKQRKQEEAKEEARRKENSENASKDPTLFSKRTAFDIRFDQIDDKPWTRGSGDVSDFFNYGMSEEDWLEYAQQQLLIRQELIDAARQKRPPDPTVVPVQPVAASGESEAASGLDASKDEKENKDGEGNGSGYVIGPTIKREDGVDIMEDTKEEEEQADDFEDVGEGGAWGAGAPPGSMLAKLMEEQNQNEGGKRPTEKAEQEKEAHSNERDEHYGNSNDRLSDHVSVEGGSSRHGKADHDQSYSYNNSYYGSNEKTGTENDDYSEDPRDDGTNSVSSGGRGGGGGHWRRYGSYPPQDDYYASSRGGWQQPQPTQAHGYYQNPGYAQPHSTDYAVYRGRGGGRAYNSGRGGRGAWNSGRGGGADYYNSNWKRPREGGDPRWRR